MITDFKTEVLPICRRPGDADAFAGTAFLIDGFLVTAGHVVRPRRPYYVPAGDGYVELLHDNWIPQLVPAADHIGIDVAFYPFPGLKSPFALSDTSPATRDEMELVCWQRVGHALQRVATSCLVTGNADFEGYFKVATVARVTHGASGCPVFAGGRVYGILAMGRDADDGNPAQMAGMPQPAASEFERNTCWVFKSTHMMRFLPR